MYKKAFTLIVLLIVLFNKAVAFFFFFFYVLVAVAVVVAKTPILLGHPLGASAEERVFTGKYNFGVFPGCRVGAFAPYFKAPPWSFCMKRPALINVGHLQLFQIKMTNARGRWGDGRLGID